MNVWEIKSNVNKLVLLFLMWGCYFGVGVVQFGGGFFFSGVGGREEERDFGFSPMYCPLKYPSQSQSSVN